MAGWWWGGVLLGAIAGGVLGTLIGPVGRGDRCVLGPDARRRRRRRRRRCRARRALRHVRRVRRAQQSHAPVDYDHRPELVDAVRLLAPSSRTSSTPSAASCARRAAPCPTVGCGRGSPGVPSRSSTTPRRTAVLSRVGDGCRPTPWAAASSRPGHGCRSARQDQLQRHRPDDDDEQDGDRDGGRRPHRQRLPGGACPLGAGVRSAIGAPTPVSSSASSSARRCASGSPGSSGAGSSPRSHRSARSR
jgi:hypothetical protein